VSILVEAEHADQRRDAFAAWADVYDEQINPLLVLEERFLPKLLPQVKRRDVLDVGCGTGRWLANLSTMQPRSLHGIDPSPEMLERARAKNIANAQLSLADCSALPVTDSAFDLLLASFVLSYVADLHSVARELARAARSGADLFVSDMHLETAAKLGWNRSFRKGEAEVRLPAATRGIAEIVEAFAEAGMEAQAILEVPFGEPERNLFVARRKLERYVEAETLPAIYILHLSKRKTAQGSAINATNMMTGRLLHSGRCALGPGEMVATTIQTHESHIHKMSTMSLPGPISRETSLDLSGYLLLPGLINAHDHLEFALFPRLGRGPYQNSTEWARDIQRREEETIAKYREIPKRLRLWWGGIRNLLSGVTTVCHHNPIAPLLLTEEFPIRVLSRFGWEHSLTFADDLRAAHRETADDEPFVLHACEGIDRRSEQELNELDRLGVLDQRTVLVHGLALDADGAALLNQRGAALIICPSSNAFLFRRIPSPELLDSISQLALGSDSPLTGIGDLLDEIRFAATFCSVSSQRLYSLVTDSAASVLRLNRGEGSIRCGAPADLIAVKDRKGKPADILHSLTTDDIELVLLSGRVQLASQSIYEKLPASDRNGLEPLSVDGLIRWLRAPAAALLAETESILGEGMVRVGGKSVCRPAL
jgi:cytosine/adenosine deaminase-related metal-dependent hydrolase/ubiquinone/menaquinone biosynthesis C-methylase UbiE